MTEPPTTPEPGWYPTPSGGQRYWDGENWLDLPDPDGPEPDAPASSKGSRAKWVVAAVLVALVLVGGVTFAAVSINNAREEARAAESAAQEAAAEAAAAEEEAAAAEQAEAEEREAEEAAQQSELERREEAVPEIEDSIGEMAEEHIEEGLIDGPVLEVTCSPVGGGSLEDLSQQTTVFECFVANEEVSGGRYSGYTYNATMNWATGSFTYGIGQP